MVLYISKTCILYGAHEPALSNQRHVSGVWGLYSGRIQALFFVFSRGRGDILRHLHNILYSTLRCVVYGCPFPRQIYYCTAVDRNSMYAFHYKMRAMGASATTGICFSQTLARERWFMSTVHTIFNYVYIIVVSCIPYYDTAALERSRTGSYGRGNYTELF